MPDTTFIYGLVEPDTGKLRYIGKANDPKLRVRQHLKEKRASRKKNWFGSLKRRGLLPVMQLLLEVPKADWQFWEQDMIQTFREAGYNLVNGTDGGDGTEGFRHSESARERIGKAQEGNTHSIGRVTSEETRIKQSRAAIGRKTSDGTKEKLRALKLGRPLSMAHRANIGAARKGKPWSEVARIAHAEAKVKKHES